jgi:hypothetical protein
MGKVPTKIYPFYFDEVKDNKIELEIDRDYHRRSKRRRSFNGV